MPAQVTAAQLRAGRALVKLEQQMVCERSGVSIATLRRMENAEGPVRGSYDNVAAVLRTLETAGVIFVEENGEGPGVRLRKERSGERELQDVSPLERR